MVSMNLSFSQRFQLNGIQHLPIYFRARNRNRDLHPRCTRHCLTRIAVHDPEQHQLAGHRTPFDIWILTFDILTPIIGALVVLGGELAVPYTRNPLYAGLNSLSRAVPKAIESAGRSPRNGRSRTSSGPEGSSDK
jgi:hypothetical protein